jgi:D-3-phosphoglycerate dehydrogenase
MKTRILLTTTSFQDTPGTHHALLADTGWEIVTTRGPLTEEQLLPLVGDVDGVICGDDAWTETVITAALPRLRVISKYGIGVDKIDTVAATRLGIPVCYTPGVNHVTVAEHTFALLLGLMKNLVPEVDHTRGGRWTRITGREIHGKTLGIVGLGRIGREVALRARAFGLSVGAYDPFWPTEFAEEHGVLRYPSPAELFRSADIVSLHTNLTDETRHIVDARAIRSMRDGCVIVNCARGELVDTDAMVAALESGRIGGYATDVLDEEPPRRDHPLLTARNCIVTPHIASRTHESVVRQATMAVENLVRTIRGEEPLAIVAPAVR